MPAGRPSKYKLEYCKALVEHKAKGYSFESFAGLVGTTKQTLYAWVKAHDEFHDAKSEAWAKNLLYWEHLGIRGANGDPNFNSTAWIFNLKNRHQWRDKPEDKVDDTAEQAQAIAALAAQLLGLSGGN